MICGIGVDTVTISEIAGLLNRLRPGALQRIFTPAELEAAKKREPAEYLAARYAAKEALFKAVAPLLDDGYFDLRLVETLNRPDGSPYIRVSHQLQQILDRVGVRGLYISITTEGDFATAFVLTQRVPDKG